MEKRIPMFAAAAITVSKMSKLELPSFPSMRPFAGPTAGATLGRFTCLNMSVNKDRFRPLICKNIKFICRRKLELMFMKHYAPNRCLYIKVAKLRTGVGSAEMSHLQNRCLKISG